MTAREWAEPGPAFDQLQRHGALDWTAWERVADHLQRARGDAADAARRIHHLCLPVLFFALARVRLATVRPLVVGIQAPQGSGKTTLTRHLLSCLPLVGLGGASVSIDDFYLTRAEQLAVAAAHSGNPYLEHRGYPGTHDIELGEETLTALHRLGPGTARQIVAVPAYDKSAHGGRGDRLPSDQWRRVSGPLDLVFVEGWMLGFAPVDTARLGDPALVEPNRALRAYDRWTRLLDAMVVLRAVDPEFVLRWRVEAEETMRQAGRPALDRAAAEDYVRRFLPAYRIYGGPPAWMDPAAVFTLTLDEARRPVRA
jgi:D-glycerate 3-kinase